MFSRILVLLVALGLLTMGSVSAGTFTVTTTADSGPGSLRNAITTANGNAGPDLIDFNIPGPGPHTITPTSPLPPLVDMGGGTTIDGSTQPPGGVCTGGYPIGGSVMIEIGGGSAGATAGLWVCSDNNIIRGLCINGFEQDGILIEAGVFGPTSSFNVVECCFIGTDVGGFVPVGNGWNLAGLWAGIRIKNVPGGTAHDNLIVGNLVSANYAEGVAIWGPQVPGDVFSNIVDHNQIGTDINGLVDLGNSHEGVALVEGTHDNWVIINLISGNDFDGVGIQGFNNVPFGPPIQTHSNHLENNIIGLDFGGGPLPNTLYGVTVGTYGASFWGCADRNFIGPGNVIAENGLAGVYVWEDGVNTFNADENIITQNSIYNNGGLGIDLFIIGVTFNDPTDPDVGANQELNFPVITTVTYNSPGPGQTTIAGTVDVPAPSSSTVEVFRARLDLSGHGEGELYLGSTTPGAAGNWSFTTAILVPGDDITATTTDPSNNTSEFCLSVPVLGGSVLCGDVNNDGSVDVADLTYLVDYLFRGGPAPIPWKCVGDFNGDGSVDVSDLSYLVDYLFRGGPGAVSGCCTPPW